MTRLKTIALFSILTSGFVAQAAKPDFAFPKQVSKTSDKELASAMKRNDGPATVRALLNLSLANAAMEPDSMAAVERRMAQVAAKVSDPVTRAMVQLLRASASQSAEWADSALTATDALRATPVKPWADVIEVNATYLPTLYDFAVAQRLDYGGAPTDSLLRQVREFHAGEPAPTLYWSLAYGADRAMGWRLYEEYRQQWISYYPLVWLGTMGMTDEASRLYAAACEWLDEHAKSAPASAVADIEKLTKALTSPMVKATSRRVTRLGDDVPVRIQAKCTGSASLAVYQVKPSERLLRTIPLSFSGTGVFEVDTTVHVSLPMYGEYRIVPVLPGESHKVTSDGFDVAVTDFVIERECFGNQCDSLAISTLDGSPVPGVKFSLSQRYLTASLGGDVYTPKVRANTYRQPAQKWRSGACLLTDRAIYHPGDSISFAATVYKYKGGVRAVQSGKSLTVRLYDANGREVASHEGVTDELGRLHGKLPTPESGLTGYYSLRIDQMAYRSVMVSDYKAPEFEVTLSAERTDSSTVTFSGKAVNYSGFPVQSGKVRISVNKLMPRVWYWDFRGGVAEQVASADSITTDADGNFSVTVKVPSGISLAAKATVTSSLGESHEADCFVPGKPYFISSDIPANLELPDSAGWKPAAKVLNGVGEQVAMPLSYTLISSGADSIAPVTDWRKVPSGVYTMVITTAEPSLADTVTFGDIAIYRPSDKMPPMKTALWVPKASMASGGKLLMGTSYEDANIRYVLWTPDSVIERRWLKPSRGNSHLTVTLPEGVDNATLTLWTMRDYKLTTKAVAVKREDAVRSLRLSISSLRDKVTVGDRELWAITVVDNLGRPVDNAAVVLDVYAKALDALLPHSLALNLAQGMRFDYSLLPDRRYDGTARAAKNLPWPSLPSSSAEFNTYGQSWPRMHVKTFYSMARGGNMMYKMAMADCDGAVAECESVEEHADEVSVTVADESAEEQSYRMPDMPLAMWQPVLTTGADGTAQVQFTVPDANTTWAVKAVAYDSALLTGAFGTDFIASKPVMVQSSLPRFLRQGDSMELHATAINNTDSTQTVSGFMELYDPMTDRVLRRVELPATELAARSEHMLSLPVTASSALNLLGVRVRATAGNFTDGEQSVIPVLPADVTVTESTPILVGADSTEIALDVKPGSVLEFTANAAWECVTALPGLRKSEERSVFSAISALYSAAVAEGLLRSYPQIGKALHAWERTDSALVSRLQKNEDLKIALLDNTPWVRAAESDTERMARLYLLLNRRETQRSINASVALLGKYVKSGGGLSWLAKNDKPDRWVTMQVLSQIASLKRMGYMPDNSSLKQLVTNAVKYLDKAVATDFVKKPEADYSLYVELRSAFPEVSQPSTARKVTAATVQHLVADWRELGFAEQARAALILNVNGYSATARQILESLRQHQAWRHTGVSAIVLRAFATVEPKCDDVEQIRLFLLSRKQTMDWGSGMQTSDVISAIISSGADWLVPAANSLSVKVNDRACDVDAEAVGGTFRLNLPEGGKVEIAKGHFPAWGGVWSRSEARGDSVEAVSCKELSMSRTVTGDFTPGGKVTVTLTIDADRPMDYVVVNSPRAASLQPVNQLPYRMWGIYVEPVSTATTFFINRLPKGRTVLTEEFYVTSNGDFMMAPAQVQSQYAPEFTAASSGTQIH